MSDAFDNIEAEFLGLVESENGHVPDESTLFDDVTFTDNEPVAESLTEDIDSPFAGATNPIGDGNCVVCGEATFRPPGLTKAGHKKRVPKHCDLHTPNARVSSQRPSSGGVESQLSRIQEELADDLKLLATLAGPLLPVTGMYLFEQSDAFTTAILKLSKNNQRILRVLHRAAQVAPIYTVGEVLAGTAYAVQVDTRGADPHSMVARRLKVERAFNMLYQEQEQQAQSNSPPRYATVQ